MMLAPEVAGCEAQLPQLQACWWMALSQCPPGRSHLGGVLVPARDAYQVWSDSICVGELLVPTDAACSVWQKSLFGEVPASADGLSGLCLRGALGYSEL